MSRRAGKQQWGPEWSQQRPSIAELRITSNALFGNANAATSSDSAELIAQWTALLAGLGVTYAHFHGLGEKGQREYLHTRKLVDKPDSSVKYSLPAVLERLQPKRPEINSLSLSPMDLQPDSALPAETKEDDEKKRPKFGDASKPLDMGPPETPARKPLADRTNAPSSGNSSSSNMDMPVVTTKSGRKSKPTSRANLTGT